MELINNSKETLEFEIINYEFEDYTPLEDDYDYDAQWLITKFKINKDNQKDEITGAYIMTYELVDLINELNRLYNNMTKETHIVFTEPYIKIEANKKDNVITLSIKIKNHLTNEKYKLTDYFYEDKLEQIISELEKLSLKYPERA